MKKSNIVMSSVLAAAMFATTGFAADKAAPKAKKAPKAAAPAGEVAAPAADSAAPAAESSAPKSEHRAPYGMAGCGLGSLIIKNHSKGPQIGASILNISQVSAISSGSSNCGITKDDLAMKEQEVFMEVNLSSVAKDAAKGEGEHLSAFAEILGCGQGAELNVFSNLTRDNYSDIFSTSDSKAVLENFRGVIKSNETLASACVRA
jgi:hypothetical protein